MAKENGGKNTVRTVKQLVRPVVEGMGLRLWDVRFEKEGPDWFLRIFIDRDVPLDTDTCEAVSRAIDAAVERGSTLVDVTGSYSGLPRRMVMCACSNNEVFKVRTAAHRVDPRALVMICEASEVFGEGFRAPEVGEKTG